MAVFKQKLKESKKKKNTYGNNKVKENEREREDMYRCPPSFPPRDKPTNYNSI
jgi:hypothetical protein